MLTFAILAIPSAIALLWVLVIRPYCIRNGQGYTPGYGIYATMWVDWQFAKEIAKAKDDRRMGFFCTLYLTLNIIIATPFIAGIIISVLAAFLS